MAKIKMGLVGCGVMGRVHAEAIAKAEQVQLHAVCDIASDVCQKFAKDFGVKRSFTDPDNLFDQVDAVVLALPTAVRTDLALKAFEKNTHVLIEKPIAMTAQEVETLLRAKGDLTVGCCSSRFQHLNGFVKAFDFIKAGKLGTIRLIRCRATVPMRPPEATPPPWRLKRSLNGGGIMANWGCYDLDYLFGLIDWELHPQSVTAQTWTVPPLFKPYVAPKSDGETHATAFIRCQNDVIITLDRAEYICAAPEGSWEIVGTEGSLNANMLPGDKKEIISFTKKQDDVIRKIIWKGDAPNSDISIRLIEDFANAIKNRRQPQTNLSQSLVIQKITDAIYASSETGETITL